MNKVILFFIVFISVFSISFAHPGRTDSNGGHYDRSTGEYHYHDENELEEVVVDDVDEETEVFEKLQKAEDEKEAVLSDYTEAMDIIDEKDVKIKELESDIQNLLIVFAFVLLVVVYTAYNIGLYKNEKNK